MLRRLPEEPACDAAAMLSQPFYWQIGNVPFFIPRKTLMLPYHCSGPLRHGLVNKIAAIMSFSGISQEQTSLFHLTTICRQAAEPDTLCLKYEEGVAHTIS